MKNIEWKTSTGLKKRGGARPGSGRPKGRKKISYLNLRLDPEDMDKFREICEARKTSQAKQIREWITEYFTKSQKVEKSY